MTIVYLCRHLVGKMDKQCPYCSSLHWDLEELSVSTKHRSVFRTCCLSGKVRLPELVTPPLEF